MFYIYTPQGRTFSGSLEQLRAGGLRRVEKSVQTSDPNVVQQDPLEQEASIPPNKHYEVSQQAIAEYQQFLQHNKAREAVYHAYQIMSQPVVTINANTTLDQACTLFQSCPYQVIPVLNARQQLIGSLSRRILYPVLIEQQRNEGSKYLSVIELLTDNNQLQVISAAPVTDVRRIASVLIEHSLDAIPIVESNDHLLGIVSRTDILQSAINDPPLSLWC